MYTHPQMNMDQNEVLKLRQACGRWLRGLREGEKLSQRELASAVGIEYYTFISQIESGRGRVPPAQVKQWAEVLKVPVKTFAIELMRYYDPVNYMLIFAEDAGPKAPNTSELEQRIIKLERLLGR